MMQTRPHQPLDLAALDSAKTHLMSNDESDHGVARTIVDAPSAGAPAVDRHLGRVMGGFRLERKLAEGGMGTIYRATHLETGARSAVKVLLPDFAGKQTIVQRFFNEATAANTIPHPGIIRIYGAGYDDQGDAFIAMEYLEGESLEDRLAREGVMSVDRSVDIARQIADILAAAHHSGIVHRDLKPDNIMLVPDARVPGGERVVLLDFGIAKLASSGAPLTRIGDLMGTPAYMAPEQCRARLGVDHRADLYALGCLLFRMLCGRPPFAGTTIGQVIVAQIQEPPPRPRDLVPEIPAALEELILALLQKSPATRPADALVVLAALDAVRPPRAAGSIPRAVGAMADGSGPAPAPQADGHDAAPVRARRGLSWRAVGLMGLCGMLTGVLLAIVL